MIDKIILVLANTKDDYDDNIKIIKKLKKNCKLFVESGIEFRLHKFCNRVEPDLIKYNIYKAPTLYFIANDLKLTDLDEIKDFISSLKDKCNELKTEAVIKDTKQNFVSGYPDDEVSQYRKNVNDNFQEDPIEWGLGDADNNEMDKSNMEKLMQAEVAKRGLGGTNNRAPRSSAAPSKTKNRFQNCRNDAEVAAMMYGLDD